MEANLEPCPFCGHVAFVQSQFGREFWVQCADLSCGRSDGRLYEVRAEAVEAWNRRAQLPASPPSVSVDEMPMQPIIDGRFKANPLVCHLLDYATPRGCGMNELIFVECSDEDRQQFAQLIGYSVGGYSELSYVSDKAARAAIQRAEASKAEPRIVVRDDADLLADFTRKFVASQKTLEPEFQRVITENLHSMLFDEQPAGPAKSAEHARAVVENIPDGDDYEERKLRERDGEA